MFKLIKWSLIGAAVVGSAGYFVFGDSLGSYFSTISSAVREEVRGKVPVEFEIKRAERLIAAIEPEINECKREVARAEVELEQLTKDVARLRKVIDRQERKLKSGSAMLENAKNTSYVLSGHSYSRRRVEMDLARTFEVFKNNQAILKTKQALILRQTQAVDASRAKLDSVRNRKAEMENTIASLKVQKQHLDALAASSRRFDLDDSALSEATEVLKDVKTRLDVAQKMIEGDMFFSDGIQAEQLESRNITQEIGRYFRGETGEASAESEALAPRNAEISLGR